MADALSTAEAEQPQEKRTERGRFCLVERVESTSYLITESGINQSIKDTMVMFRIVLSIPAADTKRHLAVAMLEDSAN